MVNGARKYRAEIKSRAGDPRGVWCLSVSFPPMTHDTSLPCHTYSVATLIVPTWQFTWLVYQAYTNLTTRANSSDTDLVRSIDRRKSMLDVRHFNASLLFFSHDNKDTSSSNSPKSITYIVPLIITWTVSKMDLVSVRLPVEEG
jgi:hypothetical protein